MNAQTSFVLRVPVQIDQLNGYISPEFVVNHFSWRVETKRLNFRNQVTTLAILLHCNIEEPGPSDWSCMASASIHLQSPQQNQHPFEKHIYFMEFNPNKNRRDYEHFILWSDVLKYAHDNKVQINIQIQAIGISNANNLINFSTQTNDDRLKLRILFKEIKSIYGAVSSEIPFSGSVFRVYIFKRACENEDVLWFYLCCRSHDRNRIHLSYKLRLLTNNSDIGPLCAEKNCTLTDRRDAIGNPLVTLKELFDPENRYVSSSGAIVMCMELSIKQVQSSQINCMPIHWNNNVQIKIEPQSPNRDHSNDQPQSPDPSCSFGDENVAASNAPDVIVSCKIKREIDEVDLPHTDHPLEICYDVANIPNITPKRALSRFKDRLTHQTTHLPTRKRSNARSNHKKADSMRSPIPRIDNSFDDDDDDDAFSLEASSSTGPAKRLTLRPLNSLVQKDINTTTNHGTTKILCFVCTRNMLEVDTCTLMCGHIYCKDCLEFDVGYRKYCLICDKRILKNHWLPINFLQPNQDQMNENSTNPNASVAQPDGSRDGMATCSNIRKRKQNQAAIHCTTCQTDLLQKDTKTHAIKCGHLYCADCFKSLKSCFNCNKRVNKKQCVEVFLPDPIW